MITHYLLTSDFNIQTIFTDFNYLFRVLYKFAIIYVQVSANHYEDLLSGERIYCACNSFLSFPVLDSPA